jgi:hypothetical protein
VNLFLTCGCLERDVFACHASESFGFEAGMSMVLLIVGGVVSLRLLPIDAYPELSDPKVRVITLYPGKRYYSPMGLRTILQWDMEKLIRW